MTGTADTPTQSARCATCKRSGSSPVSGRFARAAKCAAGPQPRPSGRLLSGAFCNETRTRQGLTCDDVHVDVDELMDLLRDRLGEASVRATNMTHPYWSVKHALEGDAQLRGTEVEGRQGYLLALGPDSFAFEHGASWDPAFVESFVDHLRKWRWCWSRRLGTVTRLSLRRYAIPHRGSTTPASTRRGRRSSPSGRRSGDNAPHLTVNGRWPQPARRVVRHYLPGQINGERVVRYVGQLPQDVACGDCRAGRSVRAKSAPVYDGRLLQRGQRLHK